MRRVVCLGLVLMLAIVFVPSARAEPALEAPTNFAVELKSDLREY